MDYKFEQIILKKILEKNLHKNFFCAIMSKAQKKESR